MERKLTLVALGIAGLIVAKILLNFIANPMDAARAALAQELAQVPPHAPSASAGGRDYAVLHNTIAARPTLWREVVAPAPQPAPRAPAAPAVNDAPDIAALLKDLQMAPGQIGEEWMQVIVAGRPKGDWMKIGDTYNGCTLVSFTRDAAVFRYDGEAGAWGLTDSLPRPLR